MAKSASEHFPELPIAHPELGISEYLVRIFNVCVFIVLLLAAVSYCSIALKCKNIHIQKALFLSTVFMAELIHCNGMLQPPVTPLDRCCRHPATVRVQLITADKIKQGMLQKYTVTFLTFCLDVCVCWGGGGASLCFNQFQQ